MSKKSPQGPPKPPQGSPKTHPLDKNWKGPQKGLPKVSSDPKAPPDAPPDAKAPPDPKVSSDPKRRLLPSILPSAPVFSDLVKGIKNIVRDHLETLGSYPTAEELDRQHKAEIQKSRDQIQKDAEKQIQKDATLLLTTGAVLPPERLRKVAEHFASIFAKPAGGTTSLPGPQTPAVVYTPTGVVIPAHALSITLKPGQTPKQTAALLKKKFASVLQSLPKNAFPNALVPIPAVIPIDPLKMGQNPEPQPGPDTLSTLIEILEETAVNTGCKLDTIIDALHVLMVHFHSAKHAVDSLRSLENLAPNVNDLAEYLLALNSSPATIRLAKVPEPEEETTPEPPEEPPKPPSVDPPEDVPSLTLEFPEPVAVSSSIVHVAVNTEPGVVPDRITWSCPNCNLPIIRVDLPTPLQHPIKSRCPQCNHEASIVLVNTKDPPTIARYIQYPHERCHLSWECPHCLGKNHISLDQAPAQPFQIKCHNCTLPTRFILIPVEPLTHVEPNPPDVEINLHETKKSLRDPQTTVIIDPSGDPTPV